MNELSFPTSCGYDSGMEKTQTTTTLTNSEFRRVLELMMNEWDRCTNTLLKVGFNKEEAAKIVGDQMTEWLNNRHAW